VYYYVKEAVILLKIKLNDDPIVVKAIKEVETNTKEVSATAEVSNSKMQSLVNSVNAVNESFKDFVAKITGFGQNVNQINEITNLINSIAEQTNLLALNAAIEAARAGEAGKGFAVVADEIRKLAEQTKASSEKINILISGISSDTDMMVKTTGVMEKELNSQVIAINTAIDSFKLIIKGIGDISPKIEAVNTSAVELDNEKDNILEKIEGMVMK
jgi:methyl-accepting chemotaxis protein